MKYHTIKLGSITRELPIVSIGPKIKVASFNLLGDQELVKELAKNIASKLKNIKFDYFVGPEVKVVPLLHELSEITGKAKYVVCRKQIHGYMVSPLKSNNNHGLVINGSDSELIKNKTVIVIDDVVTSGSTFHSVEELMRLANASIVKKIAVFKQGENLHPLQQDILFLGSLPVFSH